MKHLNDPADEYAGRFDMAWGGIASLSTALSVVWSDAQPRGCTLSQLAQWMSLAPAKLVGIADRVGSIEPGKHANLLAFDSDDTLTVTPEVLHYRHKISPYMGEHLRGVVRSTWLRGEIVFTRNATGHVFPVTPRGREYAIS